MNQVQQFVKRFVSDDEFRRQAIQDPSTALAQYRLTAPEQAALRRMALKASGQSAAIELGGTSYWL